MHHGSPKWPMLHSTCAFIHWHSSACNLCRTVQAVVQVGHIRSLDFRSTYVGMHSPQEFWKLYAMERYKRSHHISDPQVNMHAAFALVASQNITKEALITISQGRQPGQARRRPAALAASPQQLLGPCANSRKRDRCRHVALHQLPSTSSSRRSCPSTRPPHYHPHPRCSTSASLHQQASDHGTRQASGVLKRSPLKTKSLTLSLSTPCD